MLTWTVAYRTTTNRGIFHRVGDLHLTWQQALRLAGYLTSSMDTSVWYVPSRQAELDGNVPTEDVANVLIDSGSRIRIVEDGVLPFETTPNSYITVKTAWYSADVFVDSGRIQVYLLNGHAYELDVTGIVHMANQHEDSHGSAHIVRLG